MLDEADKLFELGKESKGAGGDASNANGINADKSFLGQVDEILAACSHPKVSQSVSHSAGVSWVTHSKPPQSYRHDVGVPDAGHCHCHHLITSPTPYKHQKKKQVQRALFSATLPPAVEDLASTVLREPVKVRETGLRF